MSEEKSNLDLSAIGALQNLPPAADSKTISETEDLKLRTHLRGLEQDIDERKKYANRIFVLVAIWLAVVVVVLVADGIRWPWMAQYIGFDLPEAVLMALITTTTGGVVGILLIVARYLFPQRPAK